MILAAIFGIGFIALVLWSAVIAWHIHTYVLQDDRVHKIMLTVFMAGNIVFVVAGLVLFLRVSWQEISAGVFENLSEQFGNLSL